MAETELRIFLIIANIILLAFFAGVFLFVWQYRKRKLLNEKEKQGLHVSYQNEILNARVEAQAQTMLFIGQEIHDNVGQKLTLASLYAKQSGVVQTEAQQDKIGEIGRIIDESLSELRQLSKSLSNPQLANAGLMDLLTEEAKRINASGITRVSITGNASGQFIPHAQKNILFRLLQEFIQNSLKHAQCHLISINIDCSANHLLIDASDDGIGFSTADQFTGIGLKNMKKRAEQLLAEYNLTSAPGVGTKLVLSFNMNS
jgi:signal transduction histidine kinase